MLYHAAQKGAINLILVLEEVLLSMRRSGNFELISSIKFNEIENPI